MVRHNGRYAETPGASRTVQHNILLGKLCGTPEGHTSPCLIISRAAAATRRFISGQLRFNCFNVHKSAQMPGRILHLRGAAVPRTAGIVNGHASSPVVRKRKISITEHLPQGDYLRIRKHLPELVCTAGAAYYQPDRTAYCLQSLTAGKV